MAFVRNAWYVAAQTDELDGALLARRILGEPVVLYRTPDGRAAALEDRCCHRRVPLSCGRLVDDLVQCGYHGLLFDRAGRCTAIPGAQVRPPSTARVRAYPLCERDGYVWIWMSDPNRADSAAVPDLHQNGGVGWAATGAYLPTAAGYQIFVDNLLDLSHVAFVHAETIGSDDSAAELVLDRSAEGVVRLVRDARDIPTPPLYLKQGFGPRCNQRKTITYVPPITVTIDITTSEVVTNGHAPLSRHILVINVMTPETPTATHYFWSSARDFALDDAELTALFHRETHKAFVEDRTILEAQQRSIDAAPDAPEVLLGIDVGPIQARKLVERLIAAESAVMDSGSLEPESV